MIYSFELIKHANIRYRDAVCKLSRCELQAMLRSLSVLSEISEEYIGASQFLTFESRELNSDELLYLSGHSSVCLMAEKKGDWLRPMQVYPVSYLPDDLPEVLKYKGKTAVPFTRMMINVAVALSSPPDSSAPLLFFDPVCGKGTACFCALTAGMNAIGLDQNRKEIKEASDYFSRYLKYHRLKHDICNRSGTVGKKQVPFTLITFADTRDNYRVGQTHFLALACADTSCSPSLFRRNQADLIVADLPYGVQHAPLSGQKAEPLQSFLHRVLPEWKRTLRPGGSIALSFNILTLPAIKVREALVKNGFILPQSIPVGSLEHEVEQAVVRDVIFALNPEEE